MKNEEKFKTADERVKAFDAYCKKNTACPATDIVLTGTECSGCIFNWLALEAEEEKPEPCPFCGSDVYVQKTDSGYSYEVSCHCGYNSKDDMYESAAVAAHNRVARAVRAARKGDEK